ncbi:hypothetical protein C7434_0127 [Pantoea sp. PNA 14-12]|nr:hypothetical protein C7434_0127 [Pantoea sp. PNA 14-12]
MPTCPSTDAGSVTVKQPASGPVSPIRLSVLRSLTEKPTATMQHEFFSGDVNFIRLPLREQHVTLHLDV